MAHRHFFFLDWIGLNGEHDSPPFFFNFLEGVVELLVN